MANAVDSIQVKTQLASDPARNAFAITKSDSVDISHVTTQIYVGGTGDLAVVTAGGDTVTFESVPAGTVLKLRVKRVLSTGTSASKIVGMY